jgi:hypothetical protein
MALESARLSGMPKVAGRVFVMVSPEVGVDSKHLPSLPQLGHPAWVKFDCTLFIPAE